MKWIFLCVWCVCVCVCVCVWLLWGPTVSNVLSGCTMISYLVSRNIKSYQTCLSKRNSHILLTNWTQTNPTLVSGDTKQPKTGWGIIPGAFLSTVQFFWSHSQLGQWPRGKSLLLILCPPLVPEALWDRFKDCTLPYHFLHEATPALDGSTHDPKMERGHCFITEWWFLCLPGGEGSLVVQSKENWTVHAMSNKAMAGERWDSLAVISRAAVLAI